MKQLGKYFLQGLIFLAPAVITGYLLYEVFNFADNLLDLPYPGLGVLVLLVFVTLVGVLGNLFLSLPISGFLNDTIAKVPLINLIYSSLKDLVNSFSGKKKGFNRPAMVRLYENSEIHRLGFITDDASAFLQSTPDDPQVRIAVYVPHSFAISGQLFLVPPHYVTPINQPSRDLMKYIIAGGVTHIDEVEGVNAIEAREK